MKYSEVTCTVSFSFAENIDFLSDVFSVNNAVCGFDKVDNRYYWKVENRSHFVDDSLDVAYRFLADKIEVLEQKFSEGLELRIFVNIELEDRTPACSLSSNILKFFGKWAEFVDIDIQR